MTPFRFNHAELNRIAHEGWGLRYPVELQRSGRRRRVRMSRFGNHTVWQYRNGRCVHDIRLVNHDLRTMLETLAHELEHAAQAERVGARSMARMGAEESWEWAAERAEARWRELLPCIRHPRTKETT